MTYFLGIDLGTTYTAAATSRHGRQEIFQLGERAASIPSIVLLREDGEILVGEVAMRRSAYEHGRAAREFKRRLGDPVPFLLGGTPYSTEALSAQVLKAVVASVAEREGEPPAAITVTHPASYTAYRMELLNEACRQANIPDPVFCSEPVAAAVHYASRERVNVGEKIGIYDLGGGTFDAAIVEKTEDGFRVIGRPDGIDRLGGLDFDQAVFAHVVTALELNVNAVGSSEAGEVALARLREECREAKEALSADTEVTIPVLLPGIQTQVRLTRGEFELMVKPRLEETVGVLERAAASADLTLSELDRVLLVGGSSRIPLVGQLVAAATGKQAVVDSHPKHAIALGAAAVASGAARANATFNGVAEPPPPDDSPPTQVLQPDEGRPSPRRAPTALLLVMAGVLVAGAIAAALLLGRGDRHQEATVSSLPTTAQTPTAAAAAVVASQTLVASATPTASINAISIVNGRYNVEFTTSNLTLSGVNGVVHVHFFFDTVGAAAAGVPGTGPWFVYGGSSPFTGYSVAERPPGARQICILVANPDHSVRSGTGNCRQLP